MPVAELRVALTTEDYERVVAFYRDGLGLDPAAMWTNDEGGRGVNIGDFKTEAHLAADPAANFDLVDAGGVAGVEDLQRGSTGMKHLAAVARAQEYGAVLEHEPMLTPWNDLNARLRSPDGLQITLFQPITE